MNLARTLAAQLCDVDIAPPATDSVRDIDVRGLSRRQVHDALLEATRCRLERQRAEAMQAIDKSLDDLSQSTVALQAEILLQESELSRVGLQPMRR